MSGKAKGRVREGGEKCGRGEEWAERRKRTRGQAKAEEEAEGKVGIEGKLLEEKERTRTCKKKKRVWRRKVNIKQREIKA